MGKAIMQEQTPAIGTLPKDVWVQVFKRLLEDKRPQNAYALSLVCRDFHTMLHQREDLKPYQTLKARWLAIVKAELSLEHRDQLDYFTYCAMKLQICASGPVGCPQKLSKFNYLECQYLRLVELAMNGFQPWHGGLLLKAKAMLVEDATLAKLTLLVTQTKNPKLHRADEQTAEYLVYLKAKVVLGVLKDQPLESIFSSQPPQHKTSICNIL